MIRVSTRGRYALRAMVDLALHNGQGPVLRQDIAERQQISAAYVSQLFARLAAAGLVEGIKGPGGGYCLARDSRTITAAQVVCAVEGPVAVVFCVEPRAEPACSRVEGCATHLLWGRLSGVITEFLDSITLQELCEEARQLAAVVPSGEGTSSEGVQAGSLNYEI